MDEEQLLAQLNKTELSARLKRIRAIYQRLEAEQERFCERFDVHCKTGCGSCCEHFTPDLTELEAEYIAFGLIANQKEEEVLESLQKSPENSIACPLYNWDDTEHHCTVYRWRPLLCRLFGAAASRNKRGLLVFRKCRWNDNGHDLFSEELTQYPQDLVVMSDFGELMEEAEPGKADTLPLPEALERAISKIRLLLLLEEEARAESSESTEIE